jgi:hypothetical protein
VYNALADWHRCTRCCSSIVWSGWRRFHLLYGNVVVARNGENAEKEARCFQERGGETSLFLVFFVAAFVQFNALVKSHSDLLDVT